MSVCGHVCTGHDALELLSCLALYSWEMRWIHQDPDEGKAITENEWIKILLEAFKVQMKHSLENWCFDCHTMATNHKDWNAISVCSAQNSCLIHNKTISSGLIRDQNSIASEPTLQANIKPEWVQHWYKKLSTKINVALADAVLFWLGWLS